MESNEFDLIEGYNPIIYVRLPLLTSLLFA